jgi:hypothetical protein
MWTWFNCFLSGRHDFGVWCEPGAIFLRCIHCGKRSSGWAIDLSVSHAAKVTKVPSVPKAPTLVAVRNVPAAGARVLPFDRVAAQ